MAVLVLAAPSALAAPRYLDDCLAPDSTVTLRIEACTFALRADSLDDRQRVQALLSRARGYVVNSWIYPANQDLMEAKRLAPDDPEVATAFADLSHFVGGRQDRAIAGYNQVVQHGTADSATLMKLGMSYIMANDFKLAQKTFDRILTADPENVGALIWRSTTYAHFTQYDLALADLDRAVAKDPQNTEARQWRGEELLYAGRFDQAIEDLDFTLAARPDSPFYRLRGMAEYAIGRLAAADEDFNHDLNFDPVYAHLAVWRFLAEKRQGSDGSAALLSIMGFLDGRWPTPLFKLVLDQGSLDEALASAASTKDETLRRVRESQAHCIIGEWLTLKGDSGAARAHFEASRDLGVVVAMDEVKARRAAVPPDTMIEFALSRARLREPVP